MRVIKPLGLASMWLELEQITNSFCTTTKKYLQNDTITVVIGITLNQADEVKVYASNADLSFKLIRRRNHLGISMNIAPKPPLARQGQQLASHGRYGDTQLVHMNPYEVQGLAAMSPTGQLTKNPSDWSARSVSSHACSFAWKHGWKGHCG